MLDDLLYCSTQSNEALPQVFDIKANSEMNFLLELVINCFWAEVHSRRPKSSRSNCNNEQVYGVENLIVHIFSQVIFQVFFFLSIQLSHWIYERRDCSRHFT